MKTVNDIQFNGKKALLRVDFNVPLNEAFAVTDNTRICAAVPTIQKILSDNGSVVLMSHLGRPKNGPEDKFSLKHLVPEIEAQLGISVKFVSNCIGEEVSQAVKNLQNGEVLLLENVRFYSEETSGDQSFAQQLADLGDVYVNDAFGTAHRAHASTAIVAESFSSENKCMGLLMAAEVENAIKVMNESEAPFTAIVGGAKVSDKILILQSLLDTADNIIIGGGMAYTFIKALGGNIGNSLCEDERLGTAKLFLAEAKKKKVNIYLPVDSLAANKFAADAIAEEVPSIAIPDGMLGLDIGKSAREEFVSVVKESKTILWNGPMGVVEFDQFAEGTLSVGKAVAEATKSGAFSLVGGGDSVAAINKLGLANEISFISTGGGATLEFLEGKELPGIKAVQ